jgi:hypothetical protein
VRHESLRGCVVLIPDPRRPFRVRQPICGACGVEHSCKTYHLALDGEGCAIVSETIWQRIQGLEHGLTLENEVRRPPRQVLDLGVGIGIARRD